MSKKPTNIYDADLDAMNDDIEEFIDEQEDVAPQKRRNSRKALDTYMEKRRLRSHLTFFEVDDDLLGDAAND